MHEFTLMGSVRIIVDRVIKHYSKCFFEGRGKERKKEKYIAQ